jgi:glycosyltransferase involved in cell wall biosynthesis
VKERAFGNSQTGRPIRVLLIAPSLDIVGGHSVQADDLLRELRQEPALAVRFLPINPRLPGPFRALQKIKYVRTVLTSSLYLVRLLSSIWRCDVLHVFAAAHTSFLLAPAPAVLLAKVFRKRAILNYHDGRAEQHLERSRIARSLIRWFDAVATPSGYLAGIFSRFGFRPRIIPNLVETERFVFRDRGRPRPVFLHNRALEPLYNVECTLRAFALVQQRYAHAALTIAHDGPLRGKLEDLARELGLQNVRFIGSVSREQSPQVYESADIYLTSSNIDNMPLSLLECLAAGLPIVATRAGGIPYLVEDQRTALLVECDDHRGMAACIFRLLEEEGLASRLAAEGRRECEKYTGARIRLQWRDLYAEVFDGRRQAGN